MAEIGTVAAAIQLADTVVKLKKLCADIRDAPKDIVSLAEEVSVLADLLADVRNVQIKVDDAATDDQNWQRCYRLFKSSVDSLTQLVMDLEAVMKAHRRTGSIRIYLRKDELSRYKEQLERTRSVMSLAQQSYSLSILTQQNLLLLREIRTIQTQLFDRQDDSRANTLALSTADTTIVPSTQAQDDTTSVNQLAQRKHHRSDSRNPQRNMSYHFSLPRWILSKGFQILVERSSNLWGIHFRTYNLVPATSSVFSAASRDDWTKVGGLFRVGQASPFDVDPNGTTLLHVAARRRNSDACRMLLEYGCDPSWRRRTGFMHALGTVLDEGFREVSTDRNHHHLLETLSLLALAYHDLVYLDGDLSCRMKQLRGTALFAPALSLLSKDVLQLDRLTPPNRAQVATTSMAYDPQTVHLILGGKTDLEQAFLLLSKTDRTNHMHLLFNIASCVAEGDFPAIDSGIASTGWDNVVSAITRVEQRKSTCNHPGSCLPTFIDNFLLFQKDEPWLIRISRDLNSMVTIVGRIWLDYIARIGADLNRYAIFERACLGYSHSIPFYYTMSVGDRTVFSLRFLELGPKPSDWKLWVLPDTTTSGAIFASLGHKEYEMAGEFWRHIEEPEPSAIPGTFFDDEDRDRPS